MAVRAAHLNMQSQGDIVDTLRPSIFDVLGQESLMSGLKPAAKFMLKFGTSFYPNLLNHFSKYFDEYYAAFELLLQDYYLKHYSASFSENFYGLKRVLTSTRTNVCLRRSRFRSLCFLVIIPYIKSKLDGAYEKMNENRHRINQLHGLRRKLYRTFLLVYPKLCATLEFWTLILQVGYLIHKTDVHSPWLHMAGVVLRIISGDEFSESVSGKKTGLGSNLSLMARLASKISAILSKLFALLCKTLGMALLFVQFLDWWQNNERERKINLTVPIPDPPHQFLMNEKAVLQLKPHICPICRAARKNDTVLAISGYVFCYSCIFKHLKRHKCCPVTKIPASTEHLVRLFMPQMSIHVDPPPVNHE